MSNDSEALADYLNSLSNEQITKLKRTINPTIDMFVNLDAMIAKTIMEEIERNITGEIYNKKDEG